MLSILATDKSIYGILEERSKQLENGIKDIINKNGLGYTINRVGSMFTLFLTDNKVIDYDSAKLSDTKKFGVYFKEMLNCGIYLAPSQFEAAFISASHTSEDIEKTCAVFNKIIKRIRI